VHLLHVAVVGAALKLLLAHMVVALKLLLVHMVAEAVAVLKLLLVHMVAVAVLKLLLVHMVHHISLLSSLFSLTKSRALSI
jgi:hypothetical protein